METSGLESFVEGIKEKKIRAGKILLHLRKLYPSAKCHLIFRNPFELLIGSILSAQCTDERVNKITPGLFRKYTSPAEFADCDIGELENEIYSTGFFRNKAKSIKRCCAGIVEKHNGEMPRTIDELTKLDGVGRKTANVVVGNAFNLPGIIVDTHISRLSKRLCLSGSKNPVRIEADLMKLLPRKDWTFFSNSLGDHGRTVCKARRPKCNVCKISPLCPSARIDN